MIKEEARIIISSYHHMPTNPSSSADNRAAKRKAKFAARRLASHQSQQQAYEAQCAARAQQLEAIMSAHAPEAARLASEALALVRALAAIEEAMAQAAPPRTCPSFCSYDTDGTTLRAAEQLLDAVHQRASAAKP